MQRLLTDVCWLLGIGIFQDYYQSHQLKAYSPSTVAWIPSVESFMLFFGVRLILFPCRTELTYTYRC